MKCQIFNHFLQWVNRGFELLPFLLTCSFVDVSPLGGAGNLDVDGSSPRDMVLILRKPLRDWNLTELCRTKRGRTGVGCKVVEQYWMAAKLRGGSWETASMLRNFINLDIPSYWWRDKTRSRIDNKPLNLLYKPVLCTALGFQDLDPSFCFTTTMSRHSSSAMTRVRSTSKVLYNGCCHCGRFEFEFLHPSLEDGFEVIKCNCSICEQRGYLTVYVLQIAFSWVDSTLI